MEDMKSAASTLDAIREGGVQLILAARDRLAEIEEALDQGRFTDAYERAQELMGRLGPLAAAQANVAAYKRTYIVRAADVEVGMVLKGFGEVESKETEITPCVGNDHEHVAVTLHFAGGGQEAYSGDQELLALQD
jgi:hypothetical protein